MHSYLLEYENWENFEGKNKLSFEIWLLYQLLHGKPGPQFIQDLAQINKCIFDMHGIANEMNQQFEKYRFENKQQYGTILSEIQRICLRLEKLKTIENESST